MNAWERNNDCLVLLAWVLYFYWRNEILLQFLIRNLVKFIIFLLLPYHYCHQLLSQIYLDQFLKLLFFLQNYCFFSSKKHMTKRAHTHLRTYTKRTNFGSNNLKNLSHKQQQIPIYLPRTNTLTTFSSLTRKHDIRIPTLFSSQVRGGQFVGSCRI